MKRVVAAKKILYKSEKNRPYRNGKVNNNGFTLVELIIAMAIFVIIISTTISFLSSGSRAYTSARDEADLQMSSQITVNQLEDLAIEAYLAEFVDVTPEVKALLLYKSDYVDIVFWDRNLKKLYLVDNQEIAAAGNLSLIAYTDEKNRMAENITEFNMPTSREELKKNNKMRIEIGFKAGDKVYTANLNLHLRNQVHPPYTP